ncbi:hypothetical protein D9757_002352 [Collybiopsis confluens]|uniref:PIPK domain-containing protein n=1 Tax=Collybiopsis confluens TaxID=2823264 RepID=A0A8H5HY18_9AGAR|nr:hypothetical protein D9757_002352 [Collybiopsis confluens]
MAVKKPLPSLPMPEVSSPLSTPAHQHRAQFIRFIWSELINKSEKNLDLEECALILEDALDDLGSSVVQGNWLNAIRRGRAERGKHSVESNPSMAAAALSSTTGNTEETPDSGSASSSAGSEKPSASNAAKLDQLNQLLADQDGSSRTVMQAAHLLLSLAPLGSQIRESDLPNVPTSFGCTFRSGSFILPDNPDTLDDILYGFQEWNSSTSSVHFVGGTFFIKGLPSPQLQRAFAKVLKLSIYVHLSLLLEQQLLADFHVPLTFPRPRVRVHSHHSISNGSSQPLSPTSPHEYKSNLSSNHSNKSRNKTSLIPNGIISFFSKRSLTRTTSLRDGPGRSSLDMGFSFPSVGEEAPLLPSTDGGPGRFRRFSFLSPQPQPQKEMPAIPSTPFSTTLARIQEQKSILSTSAGVIFDPPTLLVRLSEREKEHSDFKVFLKGDEKIALNSLLGWGTVESHATDTEKEKEKGNKGENMTGIHGFLNQQEISMLVSTHIPVPDAGPGAIESRESSGSGEDVSPVPSREPSSTSQASYSSESSTAANKLPQRPTNANVSSSKTHTSCQQPQWMLYRYYTGSSDDRCVEDRCLGNVITGWVDEADTPCSRVRPVQPLPDSPKGGIVRIVGSAPSREKRCEVSIGKHERRFIHGGVRISAKTNWPDPPLSDHTTVKGIAGISDGRSTAKPDLTVGLRVVTVWESCSICGASTEKTSLSDGAYLFSFAKYLELLIYSPLFCKLSSRLCEHTSPSSSSPSSSSNALKGNLPSERFNIVRHFSAVSCNEQRGGVGAGAVTISKEYSVSFKIDPVEDIFEVRVPRLQISPLGLSLRGVGSASANPTPPKLDVEVAEGYHQNKEEEDKKKLRREIRAWWEGVADHMDLLEEKFSTEDQVSIRKALPRLPSTDDAYDPFDNTELESHPTPKAKISGLPKTSTPTAMAASQDYFRDKLSSTSTTESTSSSTISEDDTLTPTPSRTLQPSTSASSFNSELSVPASLASSSTSSSASSVHSVNDGPPVDPLKLLSHLRQAFHRTEQTLYTQLSRTPSSSLNDVRRAFLSAARGAERRLVAWQTKHIGDKKKKSKVKDGKSELTRLNPSETLRRAEPEWWNKACHVVPDGNIIIREDDWGSIIAFTLSTPDYHRELALMSITRTGSTTDSQPEPPNSSLPPSTSASSFFSAATAVGYKLFRTSALVQPDPDQEDVIWHEPEAYSAVISRKEHPRDPTSLLSLREVLRHKSPDANILSGSRFASLGSSTSRMLSGGGGRPTMMNVAPPSAWAKPDVQVSRQEVEGVVASGLPGDRESIQHMLHELDTVEAGTESRPSSSLAGSYPWSTSQASTIKRSRAPSAMSDGSLVSDDAASVANSVTDGNEDPVSIAVPSTPPPQDAGHIVDVKSSLSSLTSGITSAMRLVLPASPIPQPLSATSNRHHGLLSADANLVTIDKRPHIKYDWTIGKRLKFSCTVYFAKQFDDLRKRCGVDSNFLDSLSRSANWSADGGKSKSNFWKTSDDRFIIKTLVNAWNVADLQVLIELGPSYFRYMDSTASKATVLAKLTGFYTVEIRNLESGAVQSKADLLVMENLFYDQKIHKTFDLKGVQGRKVKAGNNATGQTSTKTLFDGDWVEGQQQTLTFVRPHSKAVLREALKSDADFLSKSNIMDYSLLLGVDTERKQMTCGLVDTIGSFTFAKTLEYKAKQGLNSGSGKEVTVMPPAEYQERFLNSLEKYFVACPDKWSRPLNSPKNHQPRFPSQCFMIFFIGF